MSLTILNNFFDEIEDATNWKLYAFKYSHRVSLSEYSCCNINFKEPNELTNLMRDVCSVFKATKLAKCDTVEDYSGFNSTTAISKLTTTNPLINENCSYILSSISNSSDSTKVEDFNANSFIVECSIKENGINVPAIFITSRAPFKNFKKNPLFQLLNNTFSPINEKTLQIPRYFHILIFKDSLYLFGIDGEKILNLERTYKNKCRDDLVDIASANIITDIDTFKEIAFSGHNPRKFLTFDKDRLNILTSSPETCRTIGEKFSIPYDQSTQKFTLPDKANAERLIKILCEKAVLDPFDHSAKEASTIKKWF